MLSELKVLNFAIIDHVNVQFNPGFNVLSGETGSGKSILLKSLALLMGEKSISDTIKTGAEQASVEGSFDISQRPDVQKRLKDMGIEEADGTLVVKRLISMDGRNRIYINGSLSTLQSLREIVAPLVEITGHQVPLIEMTGQHENRNLQSKAYHLDMLDQYLGTAPLRAQIEEGFARLSNLRQQMAELSESAKTKEHRLDFLIFQRDEIKNLGLRPGDEDELENRLNRLKNSGRLADFVEQAEQALYTDDDSALVRINRVLKRGLELGGTDAELQKRLEGLSQAKTLIEDCMYELREYGQKVNGSPEELAEAEEKMNRLRKLQKKFGNTVEEILAELAKIESEIATLEGADERLQTLQKEIDKLSTSLQKSATELHKKRVKGSQTFADSVQKELADLNMKGVIFSVSVEQLSELSPSGISDVEFMIQPSSKDKARPLAKIASGGELSRVLLSLKRVVGRAGYPRTYLFDEVDAGVSGVTAEKVGRKLKSIAKGQQVICVTHLPQVAAFADHHLLINKVQNAKGVHTEVVPLKKDAQVREIARMLSGEKITKASLDHAKELLGL